MRKANADEKVPDLFSQSFIRVLRLEFYDVEEKCQLIWWRFPKTIPTKNHVHKVIKYFSETKDEATGYTIHCWQGISRSTAFALGILYLMTGSEEAAATELKKIRAEADPHRKIVQYFDQELGSHLVEVNEQLRKDRVEELKKELDLTEDLPVEELEEINDEEARNPGNKPR